MRVSAAAAPRKVAFLGLGQMGARMAVNLGSRVPELALFDLSEAAVSDVQQQLSTTVVDGEAVKVSAAASIAEAFYQKKKKKKQT